MNTELQCKPVGSGPSALLIHGSATDATTWTLQLRGLKDELTMLAPTRLGKSGSLLSVADHASSLEVLLERFQFGPTVVIGSSFGAVIGLELARRNPKRVRGLIMIEPPLSVHDDVPIIPAGFGCRFDAVARTSGGQAAAELFLRLVLGDRAFEVIPSPFVRRILKSWQHIRSDCMALSGFRTDYEQLRRLEQPTLLVGGIRSAGHYSDVLDALELALPCVCRARIDNAGHMLHLEAPRQFAKVVLEFFTKLEHRLPPGGRRLAPRKH